MQTAIRSTSRPAQNSLIGYMVTLVLLVLAIGLLALRAPGAPSSLSVRSSAPAISQQASQDQLATQQSIFSSLSDN